MSLGSMTKEQLNETYLQFKKEYEDACALGLKLDISRGKVRDFAANKRRKTAVKRQKRTAKLHFARGTDIIAKLLL